VPYQPVLGVCRLFFSAPEGACEKFIFKANPLPQELKPNSLQRSYGRAEALRRPKARAKAIFQQPVKAHLKQSTHGTAEAAP
jgi:hypothetical protein